MATQKQINSIKKLYYELGQQPEDNLENLSTREASNLIQELLEMKRKFEPHEDNCYWYN